MDTIPLIWIAAGIVLILLEFVIPGLIIIFFGVGALVTGLALLIGLPGGNGIPFVVFSAVSIFSLLGLRKHFKKVFSGSAIEASAGGDGDDITGQAARVLSWDENGGHAGKVELRGSTWNARSEETLRPGDRVTVVARHGLHLEVEKV
jgi:membrane protein implicated in regulation of membrane protease activity